MKLFEKVRNYLQSSTVVTLSKEASWSVVFLRTHLKKTDRDVLVMAIMARTAFLTSQEKFEYVYHEVSGHQQLIDVMAPRNNGVLPPIASEAPALMLKITLPPSIRDRLKKAHCADTKFSEGQYIDDSLVLLCQLLLLHQQKHRLFLKGSGSRSRKEIAIFLD